MSHLNGFLVGGGAEAGAQAGERKKYQQWEQRVIAYRLELFELFQRLCE